MDANERHASRKPAMSAAHTKIKEKPKRMCPRPGTETEPLRRCFQWVNAGAADGAERLP